MKKFIVIAVAAVLFSVAFSSQGQAAQRYPKSDTTAFWMSIVCPGAGEWYNDGFKGNFPLVECVAGKICFCVGISSIIDATAGDTSNGKIRIDFWSGASVE